MRRQPCGRREERHAPVRTTRDTNNTLGDYGGTLSDAGEHLALAKSDQIVTTNELGDRLTNTIHIVVAEVHEQGGRWGNGGWWRLEPRID